MRPTTSLRWKVIRYLLWFSVQQKLDAKTRNQAALEVSASRWLSCFYLFNLNSLTKRVTFAGECKADN